MQAWLKRALTGAVSGIVATGVMSLVMLAGKRLGTLGEPPPRRITRRLLMSTGAVLPAPQQNAAALVAHVGFGASLGLLYGFLPARLRSPNGGDWFGLAVWAANYAGWLPKLGLMPRPSHDRPGRPSTMIAAHLVFGRALAASYRRLSRSREPLSGKVAVVCGGSRGLGRAVARELLRHGARVALCGRDPGALEDARAALEPYGRVSVEVCDLRSGPQTVAWLERIERELGPIDVLVANAATILVAPIETLSPADFDLAMREIFGTATRAVLSALPAMRARRRGTFVFVTSLGGRIGVPHLSAYSAAKFAEVGFAETLAAEVAKDGVRVLSVFPGLMRTGSHRHAALRGRPASELGWFGAAALTPLLSIDADRAARRVVRAIVNGDTRLTLTPAAKVAIALHDVAPRFWSVLSAAAARLLPRAPAPLSRSEQREGAELLDDPQSALLRAIGARTAALATRHGQ